MSLKAIKGIIRDVRLYGVWPALHDAVEGWLWSNREIRILNRVRTRWFVIGSVIALLMVVMVSPIEAAGYVDPVTGLPGCEVMATALMNTGWPAELIPTMVAVSFAESGCRRDAVRRTSSELSVGPLQINIRAHRWVSYACATQYHCSARAALKIYRTPQGLRAWTVFQKQRHLGYMVMARVTVSRVRDQMRFVLATSIAKTGRP